MLFWLTLPLSTSKDAFASIISRQEKPGEESRMTKEINASLAELLTVKEVASLLRVDEATVRRWIKNGILEAITLPHAGTREQHRIKRTTLEQLYTSTVSTAPE